MIQIFTTTEQQETNFLCVHHWFNNYVNTHQTARTIETDNELEAAFINIGLAVRAIIEDDKRFGVLVVPRIEREFYDKDLKARRKIYYQDKHGYINGVKRLAFVYTDNEIVYKSLLLGLTEKDLQKYLDKIYKLSYDYKINFGLGNRKEITRDNIKLWNAIF